MSWSVEKSAELYGINNWGGGYFRINSAGNIEIAAGKDKPGLDLFTLIQDLRERGVRPPILIRIPNLVQDRVQLISNCFANAIRESGYKGQYSGVYPVKVNQQRHLLEEIVDFGKDNRLGLECGSKPELLIALAFMDTPDAVIVCNGFKDIEYVETALLSQKLGRQTFVVVDRLAELPIIITASKKLNIRPKIGFRAKLNTQGSGRWTESSGARSKFGLTPSEMMSGLDILRRENMLDCLELFHFHIGSQVPSIQSIKASIKEASRFFTELYAQGAAVKYIDVGGGLGVDYDGSGKSDSSTNYSEQEYANDITSILQSICDERNVPHPNIISESGRALVAHSSLLVFGVLGFNELQKHKLSFTLEKKDSLLVKDLHYIYENVNHKNINEFYNDLIEKKNDTLQLFSFGGLSLEQRAKAEDLYWAIATKLTKIAKDNPDAEDIYWGLQKELSDTVFCNFSVFQSLPDSWALKQVFPVMPIHRLSERPERRATLADLTCDSDGKIEHFIDTDTGQPQDYLEVHDLIEGQPYYLGAFLTGAYQEILGDLHNLFGDTDTVHITINENGTYSVDHVLQGDTVTEVLSYLDYNRNELVEMIRKATEQSIVRGSLSHSDARLLMKHYEEGLAGYTYLED
ncbi:MAG: arginine decarboxylase [Bdellovibrionales bacterium RBG_16_40_8]|nr:MAG: arginine decarboxylase [Bdellovibrionales bacterium RBG_16_40_8]